MLVTTTDHAGSRPITQSLGLVNGSVVWSKNIGRDIMAGFKTLVGGEIRGYTEMMIEARQVATERMIRQAQQLGAEAVVGVRFTSNSVMQGMTEVLAYGTAVKLSASQVPPLPGTRE